jgi:hypothetical protein
MRTATIARRCLLAGLVACLPLRAQALAPRLADDHLRVAAPQLHFLTGKVLDCLHNGAPVALLFQLTLAADGSASASLKDVARFVISYDLWEEKFSVVRLGDPAGPASHLSAEATQAWCIDALSLSVTGLAADKPFWLRLEGRTEDPKEEAGIEAEGTVSLARLVELFSRRTRSGQQRWTAQAGPVRLADLRKSSGRAR